MWPLLLLSCNLTCTRSCRGVRKAGRFAPLKKYIVAKLALERCSLDAQGLLLLSMRDRGVGAHVHPYIAFVRTLYDNKPTSIVLINK